MPMVVTIGMSEFLKACLMMTVLYLKPLAFAVLM